MYFRILSLAVLALMALAVIGTTCTSAADKTEENSTQQILRPDGKPADMTKPVQVFILLGQSNMLGLGKVTGGEGSLENAVKNKKKYGYLVDDAGVWLERKDVRNVRVMVGRGGGMQLFNNEWMIVTGSKMGPEYGIGHPLGNALEAPVMILKSCIGNRSLGWDLLPPGSERYEFEGKVYAGYKDRPDSWELDKTKGTATEPGPWLDKNGKPIDWYAGKQYDDDIANAKKVLAELDKYYPGANGYEVAGFFFWQGEKDGGNAGHANKYEENLVRFIKQLRKDFEAPNAKFVLATLGEATKGSGGNGGKILDAQLAVDGTTGKYPEFKGNVATVYANPLSLGGSGNSHYNGNAETYMNVGEAMGKAMTELLTR
jgi:Carbohydrate esterase, sialic acid-specific acetylesterase